MEIAPYVTQILSYGSVFEKIENPSEKIAIGWQCAESVMTCEDLKGKLAKEAKKRGETLRKNRKMQAKFAAFVADHPGLSEALELDHYITKDILNYGRKNGAISDRQIELVHKLVKDQKEAEIRKAEEAAKPKIPVPNTGDSRAYLRGRVISTKWQASHYGEQLKMLVEVTENGGSFKIFGTVPANLRRADVGKNDVIEFHAMTKQSDRDENFGFFSRPSKASIVAKA